MPSLVRLRGLLQQDKSLAVLLPEAERLQALDQRFRAAVIPSVARVCRVGAVRDGVALVYCRHGAAATRVRSQAASLVRALSSEALPLSQLKVRVRADWAQAAPREKAGMGTTALTAWHELSAELPEGALRGAIRKLLGHHGA